jgi:hypothetical protein
VFEDDKIDRLVVILQLGGVEAIRFEALAVVLYIVGQVWGGEEGAT